MVEIPLNPQKNSKRIITPPLSRKKVLSSLNPFIKETAAEKINSMAIDTHIRPLASFSLFIVVFINSRANAA